jgi:hypothetical protein
VPINFTHGGLPEDQAWHWNNDTYQKLGHIVFLLNSNDSRERQNGYNEFFAMRRMFMSHEWDAQIKCIDDFRKEKGHKPIHEIVALARSQMIDFGHTLPEPQGNPAIPQEPRTEPQRVKTECEQLSLF